MVIDASEVPTAVDDGSGLTLFPIDAIFGDRRAVFIGFGRPNVFMTLPRSEHDERGSGWDKFAAFMFYRQKSYVADTKGRVQAGILFELRGLPDDAVAALRYHMQLISGHRNPSCANATGRVLTAADFTCGGHSLAHILRPSRLAARIWRHGLEYEGLPVDIRIVQAGDSVSDHFRSIWDREATSPGRTVRKVYQRHAEHVPAPVFGEQPQLQLVSDRWDDTELMPVGISRPSLLGAHLGFIFGERPVFETMPLISIDEVALATPLKHFPGKLDRITKLKKYVLFSKPVIRLLRRHVVAAMEYHDAPRRAVVDMLRLSPGIDHETAFIYNIVMTGRYVRITRLENRNGRDHKFINWILAKHVFVSGYDPDVRFPAEVWCFMEGDERVVALNRNSGTYKPDAERHYAAARYLSKVFDVEVRVVDSN
jgi:hypothetical protein